MVDPTGSDPGAFLSHLASRDPAACRLARTLLESGWAVEALWGPEQMDVWSLTLRRGGRLVRFGIERGVSDGVAVARGPADAWRAGWALRHGLERDADPASTQARWVEMIESAAEPA